MIGRSLLIAWFGNLMLTQIRTWDGFLGLGATTIGDTHGVGLSTISMMSRASSYVSSSSTCLRRWKGILLWGLVTGFTWGSIWRRTWKLLSFPIPSNLSLYSSKSESRRFSLWSSGCFMSRYNVTHFWLSTTLSTFTKFKSTEVLKLSNYPLKPGTRMNVALIWFVSDDSWTVFTFNFQWLCRSMQVNVSCTWF